MIRTLIVDDNAAFRRRLNLFLGGQLDILVIAEAVDGKDAIKKAGLLKPDLVLMDLSMAGMNGLRATEYLKSKSPHTPVIILSGYDLTEYRQAAEGLGANAFVVKKNIIEHLLPAIQRVMSIPIDESKVSE